MTLRDRGTQPRLKRRQKSGSLYPLHILNPAGFLPALFPQHNPPTRPDAVGLPGAALTSR
jgi:hypothetical protein